MDNKNRATEPNPEYEKPSAESQEANLLFRLPQELRDQVYFEVFSSTRLTFGAGHSAWRNIVTAPYALALLRTCRRIHSEIGKSWLTQVRFSFETPDAMLDMLTDMTPEKRALIRHVRVFGDTFTVLNQQKSLKYRTHEALQLLPGLKLDRLTVLAGVDHQRVYWNLCGLIEAGSGWKELCYITHNSKFLGYKNDPFNPLVFRREPQPSHWQRRLEDRDGIKSQPSVAIYRTKSPALNGAVMDPDKRVSFEQKLAPGESLADFAETNNQLSWAKDERKKEVLVMVKRGTGVDYEQASPSRDLRADWGFTSWHEIQAMQEAVRKERDEDTFPSPAELFSIPASVPEKSELFPIVVDQYPHVDEYSWPLWYSSIH